jgi:hypothetical protein
MDDYSITMTYVNDILSSPIQRVYVHRYVLIYDSSMYSLHDKMAARYRRGASAPCKCNTVEQIILNIALRAKYVVTSSGLAYYGFNKSRDYGCFQAMIVQNTRISTAKFVVHFYYLFIYYYY